MNVSFTGFDRVPRAGPERELVMARDRMLVSDRLDEAMNPRFDSYQQLIGRIRRAVEQFIPTGSTVLVVSKGDSALLSLGERTGWHFPRAADGQYAGFHPLDSNDAITRLDLQRQLGARYLVIPGTSAWWHGHYPEFIAHVRACGRTLLEDPSLGSIFELSARQASAPSAVGPNEPSIQPAQQLRDLLEAILPAAATIAVIAAGDDDLISRSPMPAIAFGYIGDSAIDESAAITRLRELAEGIADFLVIPASRIDWLDGHPTLEEHIETSYSLVTDQRNVCRIYALALPGGGSR
jgi:hypothetical protein